MTTIAKIKMTREMLVRHFVNHEDREIRFIANTIMVREGKVVARLKDLYALETAGYDIRSAQFDCERIVVDGRHFFISELTDLHTHI